jgi:stalled ribosome rescue protein Dom34
MIEEMKLDLGQGEVYLIQHNVIKFGRDLRQVGGFLRILRFPPPIKLTVMI